MNPWAKHILWVVAASMVVAQDITSSAVHNRPSVDVGYARYLGSFNSSTNITHFLGVRYAASPTGEFRHSASKACISTYRCLFTSGDLRWKAPQRPSSIPGIQEADEFPPTCFIGSQGFSSTNPFSSHALSKRVTLTPSEDCLFLKYVDSCHWLIQFHHKKISYFMAQCLCSWSIISEEIFTRCNLDSWV